jgi:hypothetical protein
MVPHLLLYQLLLVALVLMGRKRSRGVGHSVWTIQVRAGGQPVNRLVTASTRTS